MAQLRHSGDAIRLSPDTPPRHYDLSWFPEPPAFYEEARCASTDPDAFFPEKGGSTRKAKKVCLSCEVRSDCLNYALTNDERFGIWGGLSERERRKLQRRRKESA